MTRLVGIECLTDEILLSSHEDNVRLALEGPHTSCHNHIAGHSTG